MSPASQHGLRARGVWLAAGVLLAFAIARAVDNDADLLPDDWEAAHGFATNVFRPVELRGWWRMEEAGAGRVEDFSGNGLTGWLWQAGATPLVTGLFDGAVAMGTSSLVEFGSAVVAPGSGGFTISAWVAGSNLATGARIARWEDLSSNSWELGVGPDGGARLAFGSAAGPLLSLGIGPEPFLGDNAWHHVVGVHDAAATAAFLYVDGALRASDALSNWNPLAGGWLALGNGAAGGAPFDLDEVRFYQAPLGSEEILLLPETYADADADGLSNFDEFTRGTDPHNPDTDGDSCTDGDEVWYYSSDPLDPDSPYAPDYDADDDGINDEDEPLYGTDPSNPDSDWDGMPDGWEVARGLDPLLDDASGDPDEDGLANTEECARGTDPGLPDTDEDGWGDGDEVWNHGTDPLDAGSHPAPDSDGDGMPDDWESAHGLDPNRADDSEDPDSDGLSNIEEFNHGAHPFNSDSDGDGLGDWDEVNVLFTWPGASDTDGDGLPDGWEATYGLDPLASEGWADPDNDGLGNYDEYLGATHPQAWDSDGDGYGDGEEVGNGTNPNDRFSFPGSDEDPDGDGLSNGDEAACGTDPDSPDTDGDGYGDGEEVWIHETDPNHLASFPGSGDDPDGDGLANGEEAARGTDPGNPDSDSDGWSDGDEVAYGTDPLDAGSYPDPGGGWESQDDDSDGLSNGDESSFGTNCSDSDSDDDGLGDGDEVYSHGTDPNAWDTDGDSYSDGDEVWTHGTDPLDGNSYPDPGGGTWEEGDDDGDGLSNGDEQGLHGTDPGSPDTDGDGLNDWDEIIVVCTWPTNPDTDSDGLPDGWEVAHQCDPLYTDDASGDEEPDGLCNADEYAHGTDPRDPDSDDDGYSDGDEVGTGTNPADPNSYPGATPDSDGDGLPDDWELQYGLDPSCGGDAWENFDTDGLANADEYGSGTDPTNGDTDGDGFSDSDEVWFHGTNPTDPGSFPDFDADDDGINDDQESAYGTDPGDWDSDDDGLGDGAEVYYTFTNPLDPDTDDDELPDGWEADFGLSPLLADEDDNGNRDDQDDSDGDGVSNIDEFIHGTGPTNCTSFPGSGNDDDGDGLTNGEEAGYGTDRNDPDTDNDGYGDGAEVHTHGTDPLDYYSYPGCNADADGDGMPEGWENRYGLNPGNAGDASGDPDGDGLTNYWEYRLGGDPQDPYSRDGSQLDGDRDTDEDGWSDAAEINSGTDPSDPASYDTDGDRIPDWWEIGFGLDPFDPNDASFDPDGDGRSNLQEYQQDTDPGDYFEGETPWLYLLGGDGQMAAPGTFLPEALVVGLSNAAGLLVNAPMVFEIAVGNGLLSLTNDGSGLSGRIEVRSDASGQAQVWLRSGTPSFPTNVVRATAGPSSQPAEATFTAFSICPGCEPNGCWCPGCSGDCSCGCPDCQPPCSGCAPDCDCRGCPGGCCNCTQCGGGDDDDDDDDDDGRCPGCSCDCTGCTGGCCECGICQPDPDRCPGCVDCDCPGNCENDCCSCSLPGCQYSPPQTCPGCEALDCDIACEGCGGECSCGCDLCVTIEMVTPAGNPVTSPVDSGDGQNEFTFSEEPEGKLTMNLKARVTPPGKAADIAAQCHFTVGAIGVPGTPGSSVLTWAAGNEGGKASADGDYLVATAIFTGLPKKNSDFGKKKAATYRGVGKCGEKEYEVFYKRIATNHPLTEDPADASEGDTPNWFFYSVQVLRPGTGVAAPTLYQYDPIPQPGIEPPAPDPVYGWTYRVRLGGAQTVLDPVGHIAHENQHISDHFIDVWGQQRWSPDADTDDDLLLDGWERARWGGLQRDLFSGWYDPISEPRAEAARSGLPKSIRDDQTWSAPGPNYGVSQ